MLLPARAACWVAIALVVTAAPVARGQSPAPGSAFAVGSAGPYAVTPQDEPQVPPSAGWDQLPAYPPGWFGAVTLGVVRPHLSGNLIGGFGLPFASLDWTVLPRVEVGYRLPDGAGDLRLGYELLSASGSDQSVLGGLHTRLDVNSVDFDYLSSEWVVEATPDLLRGLRVMAGVRFTSADLRSSGPLWDFHTEMCGAGPRFGFEWTKPLPSRWPLEAYVRVEGTGLAAETKQTIGFGVATPWQWSGAAAVLSEVGVGWWPAGVDRLHVVAGYHLEQWWNLGRTDVTNVDLSVHGLFVRAEWRY
jgi:hypothetical protein